AGSCGDDLVPGPPVAAPTSGTRLVALWYGYDGGARQLRHDQVFDLVERAPCRPLRWADGVLRCSPIADEAVFTDAACSRAVGRAHSDAKPTHFIGYDRIERVLTPARLYRAGDRIDPINVLYERRDGVCTGPFTAAGGIVHYALTAQVDVTTLPAITDAVDSAGDDGARLGLERWQSADGLSLPASLYDRELQTACDPVVDGDGVTRCHPHAPLHTNRYSDAACTKPVYLAAAPPADGVLELTDAGGCQAAYRIGDELTGPVFSLEPGGCFAGTTNGERVFDASTPAELAVLDRTVEDEPRRRLQRIVLSAGGLRVADDRMFDSASGVDCRPTDVDGVTRCLPETVAATSTELFGAESCAAAVPVALLPQPTCRPARFAHAPGAPTAALQLIGDPRAAGLYFLLGTCRPFAAPAGQAVYDLGPAVAPTLFVRAVQFGAR
ncbi:MAG TPA: hypothetical protein VHE35_29645, partial [Kofleriaceae bacterium]|nr:hypothetical protein [Kofleriaceae bacterium]